MKKINDVKRKRILKAISIFASVLIWIFITQTENPIMDYTVKSLDVGIKNERYLEEKGLVITNREEIGDASVVIRGRRRDLIDALDSVEASIDVSSIHEPGEYKIKTEFDIPNNTVDVAKRKTNTMLVRVAQIEEKEIDIRIVQTGKTENNSYIVESIPEVDKITIKGAMEDLENINHASVYIDVSKMNASNEEIYNIVCENESKSAIKIPDGVVIEKNTVAVINNVYEKVMLDVNVVIPNKLKNYTVNILTTDKKNVAVGLKDEKGREVSELTAILKVDEVVAGTGTYVAEIDIPDGIYIDPKSRNVELSVEIAEKTQKTISLPVVVKNAKKKNYKLVQEEVKVTLVGEENKITKENVEAYIDLSKIQGTGEKTVYVQFDVKDKGIKVEDNNVKVDVTIE